MECALRRVVTVLYTARTRTMGGREYGASRSSDGLLDIRLSTPGSARIGANPEQLFAAAWSASLESAIALAACQRKIVFPATLAIEAEVDLCLADGAYFLKLTLTSVCQVWRHVGKHVRRVPSPRASRAGFRGRNRQGRNRRTSPSGMGRRVSSGDDQLPISRTCSFVDHETVDRMR